MTHFQPRKQNLDSLYEKAMPYLITIVISQCPSKMKELVTPFVLGE